MGLGESRNLVSALVLALVLMGCAALSRKHTSDTASAPPETQSTSTSSAARPSDPASPPQHAPTNAAPRDTLEMGTSTSAKEASSPDAPLPPVTAQRKVPATPAPNASKGATSDTRKAAPPPSAVKSPATENPSTPALDLSSLEQRLKDTHAIGVFTKLSLKNQVDDLLAQFRAFHQSPTKTPPADLRHQYDLLMLKVLSLLQDGDPQLASAIASSREAIWGILVDPEKFAKI
jgi:hypothetical protein